MHLKNYYDRIIMYWRKYFFRYTVLLCLVGVTYSYGTTSGINVRLDHDIDRFINRLSVKYDVPLPADYSAQPLSNTTLLKWLAQFDSVSNSTSLSPQEREWRNQIIKRISIDSARVHWCDSSGRTAFSFRCNFLGDVKLGYRDSSIADVKGILSPLIEGRVDGLSFFSSIDVWTQARSDTFYRPSSYQPFDGIAYNLYNQHDSANARKAAIGHKRFEKGSGKLTRTHLQHHVLYMSGQPKFSYRQSKLLTQSSKR